MLRVDWSTAKFFRGYAFILSKILCRGLHALIVPLFPQEIYTYILLSQKEIVYISFCQLHITSKVEDPICFDNTEVDSDW